MLTLGSSDAVEQLRNALAVGCTGRGARRGRRDAPTGRPTSPPRSPTWSATHEAAGTSYDLVLLGNDASDTGDFQVGIRLSYLLDRPVVAGVSTLSVDGRPGRRTAAGSPDGGTEIFEVAAARGAHRHGGRRRAALPLDPRADEGQEGRDRGGRPDPPAGRPRSAAAQAAAARSRARSRCSARAPRRPVRSSTCSRSWECCDEPMLVLVETDAGGATEVSRETLTFARGLGARRARAGRRRRPVRSRRPARCVRRRGRAPRRR